MVSEAYVYSYEYPIIPPVTQGVQHAYAYSYESVKIAPVMGGVTDGFMYSFELVTLNPSAFIKSREAFSYSYENVATKVKNPPVLKVWDGTQWVTKPYYVWNGTAWVLGT